MPPFTEHDWVSIWNKGEQETVIFVLTPDNVFGLMEGPPHRALPAVQWSHLRDELEKRGGLQTRIISTGCVGGIYQNSSSLLREAGGGCPKHLSQGQQYNAKY